MTGLHYSACGRSKPGRILLTLLRKGDNLVPNRCRTCALVLVT
jgi:hypothetical protein